MSRKNKNENTSRLLIELDIYIHMELKAQAAYRNQTMREYVTDAILAQIARDKKYQMGDDNHDDLQHKIE